MIRMSMSIVVLAAIAAAPALAQSPDPLHVRSWAASCSNCHGTQGQAQEGMHRLAGMPAAELSRKMLDFKNNRVPAATIMHQLAKGYTDEQIAAIAAYFAAQKP